MSDQPLSVNQLEIDAILFAESLELYGVNFTTMNRYSRGDVLYEFSLISMESDLLPYLINAFEEKLFDLAQEQEVFVRAGKFGDYSYVPKYLKGKYRESAIKDLFEYELDIQITPEFMDERVLRVVLTSRNQSDLSIEEYQEKYKPTICRRLKQIFANF